MLRVLSAPNNVAATRNGSEFVTNDHDGAVRNGKSILHFLLPSTSSLHLKATSFEPPRTFLGSATFKHCNLSKGSWTPILLTDLRYPNKIVKPSSKPKVLKISIIIYRILLHIIETERVRGLFIHIFKLSEKRRVLNKGGLSGSAKQSQMGLQ